MKSASQTPGLSSIDEAEPKALRRPAPIWIFVVMLLLLYTSMVTFDNASAWFNPGVYTPYKSLVEVEAFQPRIDSGADFEHGRKLFSLNCAACHMENGIGNPGNGCPPLAGSEWLATSGVGRVVRIVSKGLAGPLEVKGQTYGTGTMLAIGDQLPGDEAEKARAIAEILGYARKTFGHNTVPVTSEKVRAIRDQIKDHYGNFTAEELTAVPADE